MTPPTLYKGFYTFREPSGQINPCAQKLRWIRRVQHNKVSASEQPPSPPVYPYLTPRSKLDILSIFPALLRGSLLLVATPAEASLKVDFHYNQRCQMTTRMLFKEEPVVTTTIQYFCPPLSTSCLKCYPTLIALIQYNMVLMARRYSLLIVRYLQR